MCVEDKLLGSTLYFHTCSGRKGRSIIFQYIRHFIFHTKSFHNEIWKYKFYVKPQAQASPDIVSSHMPLVQTVCFGPIQPITANKLVLPTLFALHKTLHVCNVQQWSFKSSATKNLYISCHTSSQADLVKIFNLLCSRDSSFSTSDIHITGIESILKSCKRLPLQVNRTCVIVNLPDNETATKLKNSLLVAAPQGCSDITICTNPLSTLYNLTLLFNSAKNRHQFAHRWHHGLCCLRKTYDYKVYRATFNHNQETYTKLQLQSLAHIYNYVQTSLATIRSLKSVYHVFTDFVQSTVNDTFMGSVHL